MIGAEKVDGLLEIFRQCGVRDINADRYWGWLFKLFEQLFCGCEIEDNEYRPAALPSGVHLRVCEFN
jgi:hypothetical protein